MDDPLSFLIVLIFVVIAARFLLRLSNKINSVAAMGATLLSPIISPVWDLISRFAKMLPSVKTIGSPFTAVLAVLAAGFSWWRLGFLVETMGWEGILEMLLEYSPAGFLAAAVSGEAFEGFTDVSSIFASGLGMLLTATLSHAFLTTLIDKGDWTWFPLQVLYGLIFVVFCICLGTCIPDNLGFSAPEQWWTMAEVQLPESVFDADLLMDLGEILQTFLNLMMRTIMIYLVCMGALMMVGNLLSALACGMLSVLVLMVFAGIYEALFPGFPLSDEGEVIFCIVVLVLMEIILLNWEPIEKDDNRDLSAILSEDPTKDHPFHPYALIFGGFMGGPFVWLAGAGVIILLTGGFSLYGLLVLLLSLFLYVAASVPAILSMKKRKSWKRESIIEYLKISILWIPLIMLLVEIFTN